MTTPVLSRLAALADPTRSRLLLVLDGRELTVGELCRVLRLPQSTVSRHLRILGDEGWVVGRSEGTSRQYALAALGPEAKRLWQVVRDQLAAGGPAAQDAERLAEVLAARRLTSREFFQSAAGKWDALRSELFGARPELEALLGLLDDRWTVGDLGCGTGQVTRTLAGVVGRVVAVDASSAMLDAARRRLDGVANVDLRQGELESLPLADAELDAAVLFLVLHYVVEPPRVLAEVRRALRPGGRLLVVDMMPHEHEEYARMGHVRPGIAREQLDAWLAAAGFAASRWRALRPEDGARGPLLFAAASRAEP